jgi:hypothetical protein
LKPTEIIDMRRRRSLLPLALASATAFALFGCRDATTPAMIAGPPSSARPTLSQGGGGSANLLGCTAHGTSTVSAWVGSHGASLQVGNDHLIIPGNALDDSAYITATIPADTLASIEFEPHGLQFNKDVILVLSTDNCQVGDGSGPGHVDYLDAAGNVLEVLGGTFNGGSHTVTTKIHHFSSYAIAF